MVIHGFPAHSSGFPTIALGLLSVLTGVNGAPSLQAPPSPSHQCTVSGTNQLSPPTRPLFGEHCDLANGESPHKLAIFINQIVVAISALVAVVLLIRLENRNSIVAWTRNGSHRRRLNMAVLQAAFALPSVGNPSLSHSTIRVASSAKACPVPRLQNHVGHPNRPLIPS